MKILKHWKFDPKIKSLTDQNEPWYNWSGYRKDTIGTNLHDCCDSYAGRFVESFSKLGFVIIYILTTCAAFDLLLNPVKAAKGSAESRLFSG